MDLQKKREYAQSTIDSIATHADVQPEVRKAHLEGVADYAKAQIAAIDVATADAVAAARSPGQSA